MLMYLCAILLAVAPNQKDFIVEDVKITTQVESNIFMYTVTNLGTDPIVGFQMKYYASYYFMAPDGWEKQDVDKVFMAKSKDKETAILQNSSGEFSMRVSSKGAVLGIKPVEVEFASGRKVIADVWAPVVEPASYKVFIITIVLAVLLSHSLLVMRQKKRNSESELTDV